MNTTELPMRQAIAYYRASTGRQGKSKLGLEAQQFAVNEYCMANGYNLAENIVEVRSTRKQRAGLYKALAHCKKIKATLIVADLDRLGRDVAEIACIVKSKTEVVVTEYPNADRFTMHILAAVAEQNRKRISDTTRVALQAAKRRGVELGKNGKVLSVINRQAAEDFASKLCPLILKLRKRGIISVRAVSAELNRKRVPTFREGGKWHPTTVYTLINRLEKLKEKAINDNVKPDTMITTNNNDILFDDLATIGAMQVTGFSTSTIMYGDCGNRFEPENENRTPERNSSSNVSIDYGDCSN